MDRYSSYQNYASRWVLFWNEELILAILWIEFRLAKTPILRICPNIVFSLSKETIQRSVRVSLAMVVAIGMLYISQLYFGTVDIGQEFGVIGDYNRVKNLVEETEELELVTTRIRRRMHFDFYASVSGFGVTVQNASGETAVISFESGMPILKESSREELREAIIEEAERQFDSGF